MNNLPIKKICADAATENCPCVATIINDCPMCSFLSNSKKCDCNETWAGLCIYGKYITEGLKKTTYITDKIEVAQKFIFDRYVKIICHVPKENISFMHPLLAVKIITYNYKRTINLYGIITKVSKEDNLISIAIKETDYEVPIKHGPILQKGSTLEVKSLGHILPSLMIDTIDKTLPSVDDYWLDLLNSLIASLKTNRNILKGTDLLSLINSN